MAPVKEGAPGTPGAADCEESDRTRAKHPRGPFFDARRLDAGRLAEALAGSSSDAIIVKSLDGTIRSWNRAAEEIYGYSAKEMIGRSIRAIIPEDRLNETERILVRLAAGESISHFETVRVARDGTRLDISLSETPILDDRGLPAFAVVVARDVSAKCRAREQTREADLRYRTTLDSLTEGFQILGADWRYLYLNPAAAAHGRRSIEDLLGQRLMDVFPGIEETEVFRAMRHVLENRTSVIMDNHFVYPDGVKRWFELRIEPVPEGICVHSFDIQRRREMEEELKRINLELDDRVAVRTRELEMVNSELEAFSYSVSHDLRAPLRSMDGFSQVLMEDHERELSPAAMDALRRIRAASQRMGEMIDDLIMLARVSRGTLNARPVSLSALAHELIAELGPARPGRDVEYLVQERMKVRADPGLVRIVLQNLLANAWKYSSTRSRSRIEVGEIGIDGKRAWFVSDNGVGFDPARAEKLFTPFFRLHTQAEFDGNGIGLATVRRAVHRQGGEVWAEGRPGEGATFYFTFGIPEGRRKRNENPD
jgi:PAS domain S-box-containing protein